MSRVSFWQEEEGGSLAEILIFAPLLMGLFLTLTVGFIFLFRGFYGVLGDWELQEEVRMPMERLTREAARAEKVRIRIPSSIEFYFRGMATGNLLQSSFYLRRNSDKGEYLGYLVKDTQPLTGKSFWGKIKIYQFVCRQEGEHILYLKLLGKNLSTGTEFLLENRVYVQRFE